MGCEVLRSPFHGKEYPSDIEPLTWQEGNTMTTEIAYFRIGPSVGPSCKFHS